jgi:hypothetical protein
MTDNRFIDLIDKNDKILNKFLDELNKFFTKIISDFQILPSYISFKSSILYGIQLYILDEYDDKNMISNKDKKHIQILFDLTDIRGLYNKLQRKYNIVDNELYLFFD